MTIEIGDLTLETLSSFDTAFIRPMFGLLERTELTVLLGA